MAKSNEITQLLVKLVDGDQAVSGQLFELVYVELRRLAQSFFRTERPDHTLQPTALVHEAYARLVHQPDDRWSGRTHFMAVAARAMRRVLINHAEKRRAAKRGGGWQRVTLENHGAEEVHKDIDLLALDEVLGELEALDARLCRVVELRFFSGLTVEETAKVLDIAPRTVEMDWRMARSWLFSRLNR